MPDLEIIEAAAKASEQAAEQARRADRGKRAAAALWLGGGGSV